MSVRAKMKCQTVTPGAASVARRYEFYAEYDPDVPEDERYAKYTPYAKLEMSVDNPAVIFEPGKAYYLDFTEAG